MVALSVLEPFTTWLLDTVGEWGLVGIFLLMAVESSFIPFPSELVMIPAGVLAARGDLGLWASIAAGTAGSLVGAYVNYFLARHLGRAAMHRVGERFFVSARTMDAVEDYFARHGEFTTFVGRLIPAVRQLISIPAGLGRMPLSRFTIFTTAGAGLWVTVLAYLGYYIGEAAMADENVARNATIAILVVVVVLVALYVAGKKYFTRQTVEDTA